MPRLVTALLVLFALAIAAHHARAQAPAAPARSAPAQAQDGTVSPGTYDLEITYGGGVLAGLLVLKAEGDSLAATLTVGDHGSPIRSVTRKGSSLTLHGDPALNLRYDLQFKGDALTGSFTFGDNQGTLTGKRRKP